MRRIQLRKRGFRPQGQEPTVQHKVNVPELVTNPEAHAEMIEGMVKATVKSVKKAPKKESAIKRAVKKVVKRVTKKK